MNIKVKLELNDYRKWNIEYFYGGLRGKLLVAVAAVLILTTAYYTMSMGLENLLKTPQIIFIMALGMLFLIMMPVSIFFQSKKVFLSDQFLQEEQAYDFREDGFSVKAAYGDSEIPWDKVHAVKISKAFISIYLSKIRAYVIPLRFLTAGEKEELAKMMEGKTKKT